ncbi:hypothetical protein FMO003_25510 [Moritella sp. F3]|nr:hypothetical protein FMO001_18780 [Moritella sp. F1]GIC82270.1 hypothetical protein FMO003_25510 [Moritella sp. F3]
MAKMSKEDNKVQETLNNWRSSGQEFNGDLPKHPEFIFRISGEWKGWNDLVGITDSNSDQYKENEIQDQIEDKAWLLYLN